MSVNLRKELSQLEKECEKSVVCVTGGSGFLGSAVVKRLIVAGHIVHVPCLQSEIDHPTLLKHLKEIPGADERLKFFAADIFKENSFEESMKGCKYVIHMAAVVKMNAKDPHNSVVAPAMKGVDNVLESVNKESGIERVVMTSSLAAVVSDNYSKGKGVPFSEQDWPTDLKVSERPYHYAKTMSEKRAWEIANNQNKWDLVTINPGVVFGPVLAPTHAYRSSMDMFRMFFSGIGWPFSFPITTGIVDVDDVAQAHVLAMLNPNAQGRYLCVSKTTNIHEWFSSQKVNFPQYWYPILDFPKILLYWIVVLFTFLGISHVLLTTPTLVLDGYNKPISINTKKIQQELGIRFIDPKITLRDTILSLQQHQIIKQ